jgi:hypothetical protein
VISTPSGSRVRDRRRPNTGAHAAAG